MRDILLYDFCLLDSSVFTTNSIAIPTYIPHESPLMEILLNNPPFYGRKESDGLSGLLKIVGDPNLSFLIPSRWLFLLH